MSPAEVSLLGWLALGLGAALVGFAKTAIGGVGAVAVVVFAAVLPARESTGALLPLLICGDLMALRYYSRHADWPTLLRLLPAVVPGLLLGAVFVAYADDRLMRTAIGAILLVMTGVQLWLRRPAARRAAAAAAAGSRSRARPAAAEEPVGSASAPSAGGGDPRNRGPRAVSASAVTAGMTAGFTTMTANAAGPVMTLYLVMSRLPVLAMLGTGAWFFFAVNVAKLPFSVGLGLITWQSLLLDALLVPAMVVGGLVGLAVIRRIDQQQFERAALALGAVAAGLLLWA